MTPEQFQKSLEEVSESANRAGYSQAIADAMKCLTDNYDELVKVKEPYAIMGRISKLIVGLSK